MFKNIKPIFLLTSMFLTSFLFSQNTVLLDDPPLYISIFHKKEASLTDTAWMGLVFKNLSDDSLEITDFMYMLNGVKKVPSTDDPGRRMTIGQGNKYTTFPRFDYESNPNNNEVILAPGDSIFSWRNMSNFAAVLLGKKDVEPVQVDATMRLRMAWKDTAEIKYRNDTIQFSFVWNQVDEIGDSLVAMRVQKVLLNDLPKAENWYVQGFLKDTSINKYMSTEALQDFILNGRAEMSNQRLPVLTILNDRKTKATFLNEYFQKELQAGNEKILYELNFYWDDSFLPLLKNNFLNSNTSTDEYMTVFDRHHETWKKREGLADTLADRVFEIAEQVLVSKKDLKYHQIESWKIWTEILAKSHSKKALAYMEPFLNDNRSLGMDHRKKFRGNIGSLRLCPSALRVGDMAIDASLYTKGVVLNDAFESTYQRLVEEGKIKDDKSEELENPDKMGLRSSGRHQYDDKTCSLIREELKKEL
jgi:hypothetical protein